MASRSSDSAPFAEADDEKLRDLARAGPCPRGMRPEWGQDPDNAEAALRRSAEPAESDRGVADTHQDGRRPRRALYRASHSRLYAEGHAAGGGADVRGRR